MDDVTQRGLATLPEGEVRDTFSFGVAEAQREYREKIAGLEAENTKIQAVLNRWAAKPHISKRNMKNFRKDIGGIK